jgi:uncharacterized phage protein (TIGR01671 family)
MKEIKFRGKRFKSDEWVCGSLIKMDERGYQSFIFEHYNYSSSQSCGAIVGRNMIPIKIETIGQYTGLKDKNGVEIYEGDVLFDEHCDVCGVVTFEEGKFLCETETYSDDLWEVCDYMVVVGNIYDNPELIE